MHHFFAPSSDVNNDFTFKDKDLAFKAKDWLAGFPLSWQK